jgi:hypothetical protein
MQFNEYLGRRAAASPVPGAEFVFQKTVAGGGERDEIIEIKIRINRKILYNAGYGDGQGIIVNNCSVDDILQWPLTKIGAGVAFRKDHFKWFF